MKLPLLVVGADGLLGRAVAGHCRDQGEPVRETVRKPPGDSSAAIVLDLAHNSWPALPRCGAAVICAAITRQALCRQNPAATRHVNVVRTLDLIRALAEAGAFVVFLSTNLVFDGRRPNRRWNDPLSPQMEYGRQKAEVERALGRWPERTAVVRMTKVMHSRLPLLQEWVRELDAGRPVSAFSDYVCSPVSLRQVAAGIARVATEQRSGVWQFSGPRDVSYARLAAELARIRGVDAALVQSVPTPAHALEHHPAHTTLDASRAAQELGLVFQEAGGVLRECLAPGEP